MKVKRIVVFILMLILGLFCFVPTSKMVLAGNKPVMIPADHYIFYPLQSYSGKAPNGIIKMFQDSKGFLWLGTNNGLFRHDGYGVKNYSGDRGTEFSLSNQSISDLTEDSFGNLWVATKYGLNKLNLRTYKVTHFLSSPKISNPDGGDEAISDNKILTLLLDNKRLLIGTSKGLDAIDLKSEAISSVLKGYQINNLCKDDYGNLWLSTFDGGLLKYNESSNSVKTISISHKQQNENNLIRKLVFHNNDLWLATRNGLIQFDSESHVLKGHLLRGVPIYDVVIEDEYTLWIATHGHGLYRYSLKEGVLQGFVSHPSDTKSISSNRIYHLFIDKFKRRLWVSGRTEIEFLELAQPVYLIRDQLLSKAVWSVAGSRDGNLFVGTDGGMSIYNVDNSIFQHYEVNGSVGKIVHDHKNVWVLSFNGMYELDKVNQRLTNRTQDILFLAGKPRKLLMDIEIKDQGELLIASEYGLIHWDPRIQNSIHYKVSDRFMDPIMSNTILEIHNNDSMWFIGTRYGLYYIDFGKKMLNRYLQNNEITPLDKTEVYSFGSDDQGYLWVGTFNGLFKLKDRKIIAHYAMSDGLPNPIIRGLIIDRNQIWIGSDDGMAAFQIGENIFKKIHLNNTIFDIEFNDCDPARSNSGYLYFCSVEGVFYFKPALFAQSMSPPEVVITGFRLFNRPQMPGSTWLPKVIENTDHLILDYQQNMLSFEFSALNYSDPKHLYAYQMEGITKKDEWIITDSQNRIATFTAQHFGDYTFRVKSGWSETNWSDEVTELKVTILPPWWRTSYAYFTYLLMFLFCMGAIINIRTRRLKIYAAKLKQEVTSQTEEIKGLLERKNELFANVSHELRTPLTLIIDPIKRLIEKKHNSEDKASLLLVKRNSQRLLHMVDQLLNIAKTTQAEKQEFQVSNFSMIIKLISDSMKGLLDNKKLQLSVSCQDDIFVDISSENLETIVLNLLSNAIKYCNNQGEISIALIKYHNNAQLTICDTGIGIAPENHGAIFERFKRADHQTNRDIPGTGIGLALVKELLELHQGSITVNSDINQGCKFIVCIPLSKSSHAHQSSELSVSVQHETSYIEQSLNDAIMIEGEQDIAIANGNATRILIIEDTKDMRDYLYSILSEEYDCYAAADGQSGLKKAKQTLPDLIVCDVMMPGIDGFELLQRIRQDDSTSHIPVILLTAKSGKESELEGLNKLADDYITKPFDRDILLTRIYNLLALRKLLCDYFSLQFMQSEHPHERYRAALAENGQSFLQKFHRVIEQNFQNHDFSIVEMASHLYISKRTMQLKLKSVVGQSPKEYLILFRLKYAAKLLTDTALSISQIQDEAGFSNASGFARSFKQHFKVTAREYRKQMMTEIE